MGTEKAFVKIQDSSMIKILNELKMGGTILSLMKGIYQSAWRTL